MRHITCTMMAVLATAMACLDHGKIPPAQLARRSPKSASPGRTIFHNVRVFDGNTIGPARSVFIDGELISEPFGPSCGSDVRVIDAQNRIMIPGLIDAHVHVPDVEGIEDMTGWGVTTILNMACRNYTLCSFLRDYPNSEEGTGLATFYSAGYGATGVGSLHAKIFNLPPDQLITAGQNFTAVVENVFNNKSDYYKLCAEENGPTLEMQASLVKEVHKLGRQAFTHASSIEAYGQAIQSLTDGLEHIPDDGILSDEAVQAIHANGQFVTPTMEIFKIAFGNPEIMQFLRGGIPTNESWEAVVKNVARLHEAGVPVLAGTDAVGFFETPIANFTVPLGLTLHRELENLVEAGLSPVEALRAATSRTAKHHRLPDRGVIAPGKRADLVLLDANPLVNVSNSQKIAMVFVGGAEYLGPKGASAA